MNEDSTSERVAALKSRGRLSKFISVGILGAVCDTSTLVVLVELFGVPEAVAGAAGIWVAVVVMFVVNEHWTFAGEGPDGRRSFLYRLGKSHAVRSVGMVTHFLVFLGLYRLLFVDVTVAGVDGWLLVAKAGGIITGGAVNYVFESLFTWRVHRES